MKYKVGDKVRIKSIDWYNENKDSTGSIDCGTVPFVEHMVEFCSRIVTISYVYFEDRYYDIEEDGNVNGWTDEMIEGVVEETITINEPLLKPVNISLEKEMEWNLPNGYTFKDENGNVINTTKIVLEKNKEEYPKAYEECCKVLGINEGGRILIFSNTIDNYECNHVKRLHNIEQLLICRDAYWKIAGEGMGLGKPWKPDDDIEIYNIYRVKNTIYFGGVSWSGNSNILEFPTKEMRDAFKENFKDLIEQCKELL